MKLSDQIDNKYRREIGWIIRDKYHNRAKPSLLAKYIKRLAKGEPAAYIIGSIPFLNCEIDLSHKPLIPRVETEYWVEQAVIDINRRSRLVLAETKSKYPIECLDLFAGSGCVGVAILKNVPDSRMVFAEQDKKWLNQIEINLKLNKISQQRYQVVQSDIFTRLGRRASKLGKFDYIFANPPYVPATRKLPARVIKWEPRKALFGGPDGMFYLKKFLQEAKNHLKINGTIFMEFDTSQKKEIAKLVKDFGYQNSEFHRDQYNRWRFATLQNTT